MHEIEQGLRGLTHDLVCLTELQLELLKIDARDATRSVLLPASMVTGAGLVLLGTMPVLLSALAFGLVEWLEWPQSGGFLAAALVGLLIATCLALFGWSRWKRSRPFFSRSLSELDENVARVKSLLHRPGSPHKPR